MCNSSKDFLVCIKTKSAKIRYLAITVGLTCIYDPLAISTSVEGEIYDEGFTTTRKVYYLWSLSVVPGGGGNICFAYSGTKKSCQMLDG